MLPVNAVRKRICKLWNIAPYRIEIEMSPDTLKVEVDGGPPTEEQQRILEADIAATTEAAKKIMN